jgi:prevent-host-death family protein
MLASYDLCPSIKSRPKGGQAATVTGRRFRRPKLSWLGWAFVISFGVMAAQLEIEDLGNSMTEALDKVRRGEEVTIADHGRPVAKLVPVEPEERVFGAFKGRVVIADDFDAPLPPEVLAEFEK